MVSLINSNSLFSSLVDLLQFRASNEPNKIAFTFLTDGEKEEVNFSYGELDLKARTIAATLQSKTVLAGQPALLLYPSGLEYIAAFFGCLYAGIIAIPAYPPKRGNRMFRLEAIIANAGVSTILTTDSSLERIKQNLSKHLEKDRLFCMATDTLQKMPVVSWQKPNIDSNTIAFLQYTSGSTGIPKGVAVSHGNILYNQEMIKIAFGHNDKTIFVGWLPLFHDMGLIGNILQPLYLGIRSVLMSPESFVRKPIRWLKAISKYKATTSGGPNFGYDLCLQSISLDQLKSIDLKSWEVAFNGAEPVQYRTIKKFSAYFSDCGFSQKAFYPCYGMAEATLFISGGFKSQFPIVCDVEKSALEQGNVVFSIGNEKNTKTLVSCGYSWLEQKIAIVDPETFVLAKPNSVGEIWVSGSNIANGYWNQLKKTQDTFGVKVANSHEIFMRTGDMGFIQNEQLFVTGRLKDLIIIRGRNYYPQDIELTVEQSDQRFRSNSGVVFTVQEEGIEKLIVIQEIKREYLRKVNVNELKISIRRAIAQEHGLQISDVVIVKPMSVLKTSSGKVRRSACKKKYLEGEFITIGREKYKSQNQIKTCS